MKLFLPKEHGAYAQLGAPLAAALLAGGWNNQASLAFALASVSAFLAHEALLVLTGQRGTRAMREDGRTAQGWLAAFTVLMFASGAHGIFYMPAPARACILIPAGLAVLMSVFCLTRTEHSGPGEMVAAVALASACLPVTLAAGLTLVAGLTMWAVFAAGFLIFTMTVRAVTARIRRPGDWWAGYRAAALAVVVLAAAGALASSGRLNAYALAAASLFGVLAIPLAIVRPGPRHLRLIGWVLAAVSACATILLALAARLSSLAGPQS